MHKGVAVFVEQRSGEIQGVSLELLGKGKELANKLDEKLTAILLGNDIEHLANELIFYGADEVVVVNDPALDVFVTEPYTKALVNVINERKPEIVLIGATTIGRDLGPRVSARVHTGLTADCTSLEIDDETRNLLMTRPAFGGNIMATIICPDHKPQMSTVRPGVMQKLERNEDLTGEIINMNVEFTQEDMNVRVLEYIKETTKKANLEDASIIVAAGRGVGEENIELLKELAEVLGGQIAGSRAALDAGWLPKDRQVGQTGKTVRPALYIACGISGAIQHVAGMEESEYIVAINKASDAPIFEVADLGIVGDVKQVVTSLIASLKSEKEAVAELA